MTSTQKIGSKTPARDNTGRKGPGATVMSVIVQALSLLLVAVADYLIAFFVATSVVPVAMASMADGLGFDPLNTTASGFGVWLLSSLALVLFIVVLALVAMRALWRARGRAIAWAKAAQDRH